MTSLHNDETLIVVVLPPASAALRVGGIHPAVRIARQLRRWTGVGRVLFVGGDSVAADDRRLAAQLGAELWAAAEFIACTGDGVPRTVVFAAGDLVLSGDGCEEIAWLPPAPANACAALADGTALEMGVAVELALLVDWLSAVAAGGVRRPPFAATITLPPQRVFGYVDGASAAAMDAAIAAALGRPQDPNFPRLTGRRFSKPISRPLARWDVSPNWVTTAAIAVGWLAAALIYSGTYAASIAGALFLVFSRILDDCDGEVARLTQRQSSFGEKYDIGADIAVYLAVFLALTLRLHTQYPDGQILFVFGALVVGAIATTILILGFVTGTDLPERSALARRLETTASGDFAYVFFPVAVLGVEAEFLYASAIGAHGFWLALLSVVLRDRATR